MNEVSLIQTSIEQLERVSRSMASIGETEDYTEAAINALEKQMPMKPVRKLRSGMGWEYKDYYCSCGKFIGSEPHIKSILEKGEIPVKYCDDCGQKFDWSEESEE